MTGKAIKWLAVLFALFHVYNNWFTAISELWFAAIHFGGFGALCALTFHKPDDNIRRHKWQGAFSILLALLSVSVAVYLILFEGFATQVWTFGLFFRALSDWRGPLTAAVGSGLLFGMVAFIFFQESFYGNITSLIFFSLWGVFYGIIRLRTGSILGTILIQAMQSFTAWVVMIPAQIPPNQAAMQTVYFLTSITFLIFIWRLWPKEASDYRV